MGLWTAIRVISGPLCVRGDGFRVSSMTVKWVCMSNHLQKHPQNNQSEPAAISKVAGNNRRTLFYYVHGWKCGLAINVSRAVTLSAKWRNARPVIQGDAICPTSVAESSLSRLSWGRCYKILACFDRQCSQRERGELSDPCLSQCWARLPRRAAAGCFSTLAFDLQP